ATPSRVSAGQFHSQDRQPASAVASGAATAGAASGSEASAARRSRLGIVSAASAGIISASARKFSRVYVDADALIPTSQATAASRGTDCCSALQDNGLQRSLTDEPSKRR